MREQDFVRLKNRIRRDLTLAQQLEIEYLAGNVASVEVGQRTIADLTRRADQARKCPRCGQAGAVRYEWGRLRFRCRREGDVGCGRTFNALTGTGLARLRHPEKWSAYARLLTSGFQSLANVAESGHTGPVAYDVLGDIETGGPATSKWTGLSSDEPSRATAAGRGASRRSVGNRDTAAAGFMFRACLQSSTFR